MTSLRPPRSGRHCPGQVVRHRFAIPLGVGTLLIGAAVAVAGLAVPAPAAAAEPELPDLSGFPAPRVVVVGDSILLGAADSVDAWFRLSGFNPSVDAAQSRSTNAGAELISEQLRSRTDALVVFLGANDSADTARFEGLVNQVLDSAAGVKRVYWVTTPVVRDYYAAANEALARAASRNRGGDLPDMAVLDWAAIAAADPGLTAGDGLHLKPAGTDALTSLIVQRVVDDHAADALSALVAWEAANATTTTTTTTTATTSTTTPTSTTSTTAPPTTLPPVGTESAAPSEPAGPDHSSSLPAMAWVSLGIGALALGITGLRRVRRRASQS